MKPIHLAVMSLLVALANVPAVSQVQSRLTGTVTDTTGGIIVGANVVVTNVATGVTYSTVTSESGTYTLPALLAGEYRLTCELSGFKRFVRGGLILETGFARTVDIELEVGAVTEIMEVTADTPLLESESSTVGQLIERSAVQNMPLQSRRSGSLVRLMGNVVYNEEEGHEQVPSFSMAGGRPRNQMWLLDGGIVQNVAFASPTLTLNPPSESLQEFKVEANNYSAEFGRAGGGLIVMTTRSGTNEYHGALYEFLRNDKLDARTFFDPGKAPLRYNIFGGSIGGPIVKEKTFFFFNYEGTRRRTGVTISSYEVPHPTEITGDFSNRTDFVLEDPLTGNPFPDKIIPLSRIDPVGQQFAKLYPVPNIANNDVTRAPVNNFVANASDKIDQDFYTIRVDHTMGINDRIYGRYSDVEAPRTDSGVFPNEFADPRGRTIEARNRNALGSWVHNYSPSFMSELRFLYGRRRGNPVSFGWDTGKNGEFGLQGVDPNALARISPTSLTDIGSSNQARLQDPILTISVPFNVTWVKSRHQIRSGFEWRYSKNRDVRNESAGGSFVFSDRATGNGLATLLLGWTTSGETVATLPLSVRTDYYAGYIQDDWKVSSNLTLNLGLRWEMDTPRWELSNRQSGFDLRAINPVSDTPGVVTFSGRDGQNKYAHDFDKNNFGPRFGFAYRATSNLVVRGGYGIQYNGPYRNATGGTNLGFSINQNFTSPDGGFTPAFLLRDGMPPPVEQESLGPGFGAVPIGERPRTSPDFYSENHANAYMQQWNLSVQKQLAGNMLAEVAYMANVGHKLSSTSRISLNMIPLTNGRGPENQDQLLRPFPQFSDVRLSQPPWGNSSYHSLNVKLEKRYSNGLNFLMNYTWSKYLDDVEGRNEIGGAQGSGYTHIELRHLDKSLSGSDIRHRYVGSAVYELPFGKSRRWDIQNSLLDNIAGGWKIGAIVELRDGLPYGVIENTNRTNTFSDSQRPNLLRDPGLGGGRPRSEYLVEFFDTSAFEAPGIGIFGNAPRTICCGPGMISLDLSVQKRFRLTEEVGLQFRTDMINLPNRPTFANPEVRRGRGSFGQISSLRAGTAGRIIQLSMRFEF